MAAVRVGDGSSGGAFAPAAPQVAKPQFEIAHTRRTRVLEALRMTEDMLFSLLLTLRRPAATPEQVSASMLAACLDALQLLPFVFSATPAWGTSLTDAADNVQKLHLRGILAGGASGFRVLFWCAVAAVATTVALLAWLMRSRATPAPLWARHLARRAVLLLGHGLLTSLMGIFMLPTPCAGATIAPFPAAACWEVSSTTLAVVGMLFTVPLLGLSILAAFLSLDPDARSCQPAATATVSTPLLYVFTRVLLVIISIALARVHFWKAMFTFALLAFTTSSFTTTLPFYSHANNVLMCMLISSATGIALLQAGVELINHTTFALWPLLLGVSAAVGAIIGAIISIRALHVLSGTTLPIYDEGGSGGLSVIRKFTAAAHVEIALRFLRACGEDEDALRLADGILRAGEQQFPENVDVILARANHQLAFHADAAGAAHTLEKLHRMRPALSARYVLFLREQEGRQTRASGGDSSMDLATYIEFQSQFKLASKAHNRVLRAVRDFWRLVHMANVTGDAAKLGDAATTGEVASAANAAAAAEEAVIADLTAAADEATSPFHSPSRMSAASFSHSVASGSSWGMTRLMSTAFGRSERGAFPVSMRSVGTTDSSGASQPRSGTLTPTRSMSLSRSRSSTRRLVPLTGLPWFDDSVHRFLPTSVATALAALLREDHTRAQPTIMHSANVERLAQCCRRIDELSTEALRLYTSLLERYPRSSRLLRATARFHVQVTHNLREADKLAADADAIDESAAEDGNAARAGGGFFNATSRVDDTADALIIIDSRGTILSVNTNCRRMFLYTESELLGKNIAMLVEPRHAVVHDSYLRNYMQTGVAKVMGSTRRLNGRKRDSTLFAVELAVSRVDTPQGVTFAGVIHELPESDNVAMVTMDTHGFILGVNRSFGRMFGWPSGDVAGKNIKLFMPRKFARRHDEYLARFRRTGRSAAVGLQGRRLEGLHKNGMVFPISIEIEVVQMGVKTLYVGTITELLNAAGVLTIDERGTILSANKMVLNLFGYTSQTDLVSRRISSLMPEPYATFHDSYLQRYLSTNKGTVVGGSGRYVVAKHADGSTFPIHLKVEEIKVKRGELRRFAGQITIVNQAMGGEVEDDDGRNIEAADTGAGAVDPLLGQITINREGIIRYANAVAANMFGYEPRDLLQRNVSMLTPPDIAKQHDSFLRRYTETGQARIVGSMGRHLMGQHAAGYLFPVSLTVEAEVVGGQVAYHGSIRALSDIEALVFADLTGKILSVTPGLCYLLGHRASDLEGRNVTIFMPSKYRKAHPQHLSNYRETGRTRFIGTRQVVPVKHADGSTLTANLEVAAITHPEYGKCLCARMTAAVMSAEEAEASVAAAVQAARHADAPKPDARSAAPAAPSVQSTMRRPGTPPARRGSQVETSAEMFSQVKPTVRAAVPGSAASDAGTGGSRQSTRSNIAADDEQLRDTTIGTAGLASATSIHALQHVFSDSAGNVDFDQAAAALGFVSDEGVGTELPASVPTITALPSDIPASDKVEEVDEPAPDVAAEAAAAVVEQDIAYDEETEAASGGDGGGDDKSVASKDSEGAGIASKRERHRLRQLQRMRRSDSTRGAARSFALAVWSSIFALLAVVTILFALSRQYTAALVTTVPSVDAALRRAARVQDIAYLVEALCVSAAVGDNTSWALATAELVHVRETATDLHESLYLSFGSSYAPLSAHYLSTPIALQQYVSTATPPLYSRVVAAGWWDAGTLLLAAAGTLISPASNASSTLQVVAPQFLGATSWDGLARTLAENAQVRFVLDNAGVLAAHALVSARLHSEHATILLMRLQMVQLLMLLLQIAVPFVIVLVFLRPRFRHLQRARAALLGTYSAVPRLLSARIAKRGGSAEKDGADFLESDGDSDSGSDVEGDEAGPGALLHAHARAHAQAVRVDSDVRPLAARATWTIAFCIFSAQLLLHAVHVVLRACVSTITPLLACTFPVSMPRKLGYSVLLFAAAVGSSFVVSYSQLSLVAANTHDTYLTGVSSVFTARLRVLCTHLTFAHTLPVSGTVTPSFAFPASQANKDSVRAAVRATVWLAQATHLALVDGKPRVDDSLAGTGDALTPLATMAANSSAAAASAPALMAALNAALLQPEGTADLFALDTSFLLAPAANAVTRSSVRSIMLDSTCLRAPACAGTDAACAALHEARGRIGWAVSTTNASSDALAMYAPVYALSDPVTCVASSDSLSPFTSSGLDNALRVLLSSAWALASESTTQLRPAADRSKVVQHLATFDVPDGFDGLMTRLASDSSTALNVIHVSESLFFATYVVLGILWYVMMYKPYVAAVGVEASRVISLLAFLPPHIDVRKLVALYHRQRRAALRAEAAGKTVPRSIGRRDSNKGSATSGAATPTSARPLRSALAGSARRASMNAVSAVAAMAAGARQAPQVHAVAAPDSPPAESQ